MSKILVVDDDKAVLESLGRGLRLSGFEVELCSSPIDALQLISETIPDGIVLDITMPEINGIELCERIRNAKIDVPILMLSARGDVNDRIDGLQAGGDDYLVKPFTLRELSLRLESLLRRSNINNVNNNLIIIDKLVIDVKAREVKVDDKLIELSKREFELLEFLAINKGVVLTRAQILYEVWGYDFVVDTNVMSVFIGYLRKKLEEDTGYKFIHTVRGVGFVLKSN